MSRILIVEREPDDAQRLLRPLVDAGHAAFAALDQAVAAGFDMADHLDKDEDLANIRGDARFAAFVKAVEANAAKHKAEKAHKYEGDKAECDSKHGEDTI